MREIVVFPMKTAGNKNICTTIYISMIYNMEAILHSIIM
jgi:hypothetical protein